MADQNSYGLPIPKLNLKILKQMNDRILWVFSPGLILISRLAIQRTKGKLFPIGWIDIFFFRIKTHKMDQY